MYNTFVVADVYQYQYRTFLFVRGTKSSLSDIYPKLTPFSSISEYPSFFLPIVRDHFRGLTNVHKNGSSHCDLHEEQPLVGVSDGVVVPTEDTPNLLFGKGPLGLLNDLGKATMPLGFAQAEQPSTKFTVSTRGGNNVETMFAETRSSAIKPTLAARVPLFSPFFPR